MSKKSLSFATHISAMSTKALIWEVAQILGAWLGLIYCTITDRTSWQIFLGVLYLANMIRAVGRELAYRDDASNRLDALAGIKQ